MKKILTLTAALMVFGAAASMAQSGLNLNWTACVGDGVSKTRTFACTNNSGADGLYASVVLPSDVPLFAATTVIIDVAFNSASIPAWWQTGPGQCRAGAVSFSADPGTVTNGFASSCPDIWGGSAQVLSVFQPQPSVHGLPNELRLNGGAAIPAGSEIALTADGTELVVAKVTISHGKTVGTGSCAGCSTGASFQLNEMLVQQPEPNPKFRINNPTGSGAASCGFNGGNLPTPTENRTWGAVKNLYR